MTAAAEPPAPAGGAPPTVEPQPKGLWLLFGVEMWERFSYYGMRAMLVLFLMDAASGGWGWTEEGATTLYKWYTTIVYVTPIIGGFLADRFLGTHRSLIIGGAIIAAGHFCCAMSERQIFMAGLALIVVGTGFFKSNVSTMVGQLYQPGDRRRDAGFTIYYMGINLGAALGPIICGKLRKTMGWHWGFGAAGVGMVLGLLMYVWGKRRFLGTIGDVPSSRVAAADSAQKSAPLTMEEKGRVAAIFIVSFFVVLFWAGYEQAGSSMNVFAERNTNLFVFGEERPAEWFQSVNPVVLLACAPLFAMLWTFLSRKRLEPSTPTKMISGLLLLGVGFIFMVLGAKEAMAGGRVSPWWLIGAYTFHTWGELCLSPVGLSLVTKLAPLKYASMLMGVWFLSNMAGNFVAGKLASMAPSFDSRSPLGLFGGRADFFLIFVVLAAAGGFGLVALRPKLKRLMHGRA